MSVAESSGRVAAARFSVPRPLTTLVFALGAWALLYGVAQGVLDALHMLGL